MKKWINELSVTFDKTHVENKTLRWNSLKHYNVSLAVSQNWNTYACSKQLNGQ